MKIVTLAVLVLGSLSAPLVAQDPADNTRRRPGYASTTSGYGWSTGSGYLPGTGYGGGYWTGSGWSGGIWRPGVIAGYPGLGSIWGGYGGYYGYGSGYGGGGYPGYWRGDAYTGHPFGAATSAGPLSPPGPSPDQSAQGTALREIEEGRRRFHLGDYRSAVDSFRSAVVATPDSPAAQAWFAVSLIAVGDGRNADKALRAASAGGLVAGTLSLEGLFRDDKERVRMIVALAKVGAEGSLAAAYALALSGEPVRLRQLAEKDPAARLLLPKP